MTAFVWLSQDLILAVHDAQLAEHGGGSGVRDAGLLASALARPQNAAGYRGADAADCAAAYACGIARNHPFVDGNKRTAFVALEVFLIRNGWRLVTDDAEAVAVMLQVADGSVTEESLASWVRARCEPLA